MAKKAPNKEKLLVLLDGNAIIHRAYHALPPLATKKGQVVNAVYGFALTLLSVIEKFKPDYIAASFDLEGPTFRHDKFEDYKAPRVAAPDDLYAQIPLVKDLVRAFNIPIYEVVGYEADDCVGTLARQAEREGVKTVIVTGDMDTLQLVTDHTSVFTMRKGVKDTVTYDEQGVREKYGLEPDQLPDYKGLAGDASDNIPGIKGIGAKTAQELLKDYGNIEGIYEHLEKIKESVRKKLADNEKQAYLCRELGTIDTNAPVTLSLNDTLTLHFDPETVAKALKSFEFFSLLKRIPGQSEGDAAKKLPAKTIKRKRKPAALITTKKEAAGFLAKLPKTPVAIYLEREEGALFGGMLQAVAIAEIGERGGRIAWNAETQEPLAAFLSDPKRQKILYDAKAAMHAFDGEGIVIQGVFFDVLIAAYLLSSGSDVSFPYLALSELDQEEVARPAETLFTLFERFEASLGKVAETQTKKHNIVRVFREIEMPLIPILFAMERRGIILNTKKYAALSKEFTAELAATEAAIYQEAGREFNIGSPRQLSGVLFEELNIPTAGLKKTKTAISTASSELQKIREYPIVAKIESYREFSKLKNTYLDVLPQLVDGQSRIHTNFQQAVAATGRLSSADPNLQNIPIRSQWGERLRGAFEASPGYLLVGADYSQIELRIMAHLCQDKALVKAFRQGEDVHQTIASVVFKVDPDDVTPEMRRKAKVFNFGLMYGMGTYGFAQAAEIPQTEASEFIETYFKKFSGVKKFMEKLKKDARKHRYAETELGRRRYVPEIESQNFQLRAAAERIALNMPIQGMEADIVKIGMLVVAEWIRKDYADAAHMLLQVHDELIFEVKEDRAERFAQEIGGIMEEAYELSVPIVVDVSIGKNWGEI